GVLFPLAALGALAACVRSPRPWVLLGAATAWIASCVLLVTSFRYRLPLVPVAAVFAGAGCVEALRAIRARGRALAAAVLVLLAAGVATMLRRHPESRNFAEEWTASGLALNHERDLTGAERAFRRALEENPRWSPAWSGLGVVAANRGDAEQARTSFERAVALEPGSILGNLELARASAAAGRLDDAERAYRRVLALAPKELEAMQGLGALLLSQRRLDEAESLAREAAAVSVESPSAHLLLARVLGAKSRWTEALEEAKRSCDLDPSGADAWITLGVLWTDSGEPKRSREAFDRAERAGADPRRLEAARRYAARALEMKSARSLSSR
ncbi:MAG TPA: tetratricopeptide repeat protein, partial [Thermoanaerobaculia bacterium]